METCFPFCGQPKDDGTTDSSITALSNSGDVALLTGRILAVSSARLMQE
jgi:hypothetical protein